MYNKEAFYILNCKYCGKTIVKRKPAESGSCERCKKRNAYYSKRLKRLTNTIELAKI